MSILAWLGSKIGLSVVEKTIGKVTDTLTDLKRMKLDHEARMAQTASEVEKVRLQAEIDRLDKEISLVENASAHFQAMHSTPAERWPMRIIEWSVALVVCSIAARTLYQYAQVPEIDGTLAAVISVVITAMYGRKVVLGK